MAYNAGRLLIVIIIALCLAGCFEYEEEMVLNKNGSGTLHVHYSKLVDSDVSTDDFNLPEEEDDILAEVEKRWTSPHVKLVDFEVRDRSKTQEVEFTVKFEDVEYLNDLEQFIDSVIKFSPGRRCRYQRIITTDSEWDDDDNSDFGRALASLIEDAVLDKIKFRFEVKMPRKIKSSNADWIRDEKNAVWRFTATDLVQGEFEMVVKCK